MAQLTVVLCVIMQMLVVPNASVNAFQNLGARRIQHLRSFGVSSNKICSSEIRMLQKVDLNMLDKLEGGLQRMSQGRVDRREMLILTSLTTLAGFASPAFSRATRSNDGGKWASHFGEFSEEELSGFSTTSSGLKIKDQVQGDGAGYLLEDGVPFDSSYERRRPFSFRVGGGDVIRGWDEAVRSMRVGGRRVAIIPPELGYGAGGAGGGRIPGGATLVFFLELLSIAP